MRSYHHVFPVLFLHKPHPVLSGHGAAVSSPSDPSKGSRAEGKNSPFEYLPSATQIAKIQQEKQR